MASSLKKQLGLTGIPQRNDFDSPREDWRLGGGLALAIAVGLAACTGTGPTCSETATVDTVKKVYSEAVVKTINLTGGSLEHISQVEALTSVEVRSIRTVGTDKPSGRASCEATFSIKVPSDVARVLALPGTPLSAAVEMLSLTFNKGRIERDIEYTTQLTDDRREVSVVAGGIVELAQLIGMLGANGVFKPAAPEARSNPVESVAESPIARTTKDANTAVVPTVVPAAQPPIPAMQAATPEPPITVAEMPAVPLKSANTVVTSPPIQPSFKCEGSLSKAEAFVCSNPVLAEADSHLAAAYKRAMAAASEPETLKQEQRSWLKKRQNCSDVECLQAMYATRTQELSR